MTNAHRVNSKQRRKFKARISESQNHRCCYCGVRFHDDPKHPSYSTFEHVITQENNGNWSRDNIVLACMVCNIVRSKDRFKNMSAEYFYDSIIRFPELLKWTRENFMKKYNKLRRNGETG